ncbi:hypothetical protein GB851_07385 [Kingella kingae]|nr:hypothetical protein GB851_07385 [Kingella kingae]
MGIQHAPDDKHHPLTHTICRCRTWHKPQKTQPFIQRLHSYSNKIGRYCRSAAEFCQISLFCVTMSPLF